MISGTLILSLLVCVSVVISTSVVPTDVRIFNDCATLHTGVYPDGRDCQRYVQCWRGQSYFFRCFDGFVFNPCNGTCVFQKACIDPIYCAEKVGFLFLPGRAEQEREDAKFKKALEQDNVAPKGGIRIISMSTNGAEAEAENAAPVNAKVQEEKSPVVKTPHETEVRTELVNLPPLPFTGLRNYSESDVEETEHALAMLLKTLGNEEVKTPQLKQSKTLSTKTVLVKEQHPKQIGDPESKPSQKHPTEEIDINIAVDGHIKGIQKIVTKPEEKLQTQDSQTIVSVKHSPKEEADIEAIGSVQTKLAQKLSAEDESDQDPKEYESKLLEKLSAEEIETDETREAQTHLIQNPTDEKKDIDDETKQVETKLLQKLSAEEKEIEDNLDLATTTMMTYVVRVVFGRKTKPQVSVRLPKLPQPTATIPPTVSIAENAQAVVQTGQEIKVQQVVTRPIVPAPPSDNGPEIGQILERKKETSIPVALLNSTPDNVSSVATTASAFSPDTTLLENEDYLQEGSGEELIPEEATPIATATGLNQQQTSSTPHSPAIEYTTIVAADRSADTAEPPYLEFENASTESTDQEKSATKLFGKIMSVITEKMLGFSAAKESKNRTNTTTAAAGETSTLTTTTTTRRPTSQTTTLSTSTSTIVTITTTTTTTTTLPTTTTTTPPPTTTTPTTRPPTTTASSKAPESNAITEKTKKTTDDLAAVVREESVDRAIGVPETNKSIDKKPKHPESQHGLKQTLQGEEATKPPRRTRVQRPDVVDAGLLRHLCNLTSVAESAVCQCPSVAQTAILSPSDLFAYCQNLVCLNGGMYLTLSSGHCGCVCPVGWKGANCQELADHSRCHCANGGKCVAVGNGSFACECPIGFFGGQCEHSMDRIEPRTEIGLNVQFKQASYERPWSLFGNYVLCTTNMCVNGGMCLRNLDTGRRKCFCSNNYSGQFCESFCEYCV